MMDDHYPLEGYILEAAEEHRPEDGGGCTCGFCAWSAEHVAVMAYRSAVDAATTIRFSNLRATF